MYDITSFESFEGAKSWVRELKLYGQPNVVVALAANKCDLEQYRAVSTHEGQAYARENELTYVETSAKSAHNVRHMFVELGKHAPPSKPAKPSAEPTEPTNAPSVPPLCPLLRPLLQPLIHFLFSRVLSQHNACLARTRVQ